jgi:hypothetical protein
MNNNRILLIKIGGKKARKKFKGESLLSGYMTNIQFARKTKKNHFLFGVHF